MIQLINADEDILVKSCFLFQNHIFAAYEAASATGSYWTRCFLFFPPAPRCPGVAALSLSSSPSRPSRLSPCLTSAVGLIPQLRSLYSLHADFSSFICHFPSRSFFLHPSALFQLPPIFFITRHQTLPLPLPLLHNSYSSLFSTHQSNALVLWWDSHLYSPPPPTPHTHDKSDHFIVSVASLMLANFF